MPSPHPQEGKSSKETEVSKDVFIRDTYKGYRRGNDQLHSLRDSEKVSERSKKKSTRHLTL